MYVIIDCDSHEGSWKANTLEGLIFFSQEILNIETDWIDFSEGDCCCSDCGRWEAQKGDGRKMREIEAEWIFTPDQRLKKAIASKVKPQLSLF